MKIHLFPLLTALFLTVPLTAQEQGPFCGAVGTAGCNAIAQDSNIIVNWATGCTVVRGPEDITDPEGPTAIFGNDSDGVGPAGVITTVAVSLGDGGTATLTFDRPIRNGEGPDFAVFENSFNDYFLELAFVEVSTDGERYVRFPATSLTPTDVQVGSYGSVDPTYINNLAGKFRVGYGTPFDLDELADSAGIDIDSIVYVRLIDAVGTIDSQYATYDAYGHIVNDPYPTYDPTRQYRSGGFDLTGVAVMHENNPSGVEQASSVISGVWPLPATDRIYVACHKVQIDIQIFDINGRLMQSGALHQGNNAIDISAFPAGIYLLRAEGTTKKIVKR